MATYIQCKAGAFRKIEDITIPLKKDRSECRLKRYASVTDTRVWMNNPRENKAFIIQLMGQEPSIEKRKIMGQIIPIDMIWKILLSHKNNYIFDLEDRIQNFVDLLQRINLSRQQIIDIRHLCATTFRSINDYLLKYKITTEPQHPTDIEKSIQAVPRMLSTIMEAKVLTNNFEIGTLETEMCDNTTFTNMKTFMDRSCETTPRSLTDVSLQVVIPPCRMSDKCVAVKVRSSTGIAKKKSLKDHTTEASFVGRSLGVGDQCSTFLNRAVGSVLEMVNKSQSVTVAKRDACCDSVSVKSLKEQATEITLESKKSCGVGSVQHIPLPVKVNASQSDTICKIDASCEAIRQRSSAVLERKKSLKEQTTEISLGGKKSFGVGDICVAYPSCGVGSMPEMLNKSQSDIICKRDASGDAIRTRSGKSSVSFATRTESIPIYRRLKSSGKAFDSSDAINPLEIINDLVGISRSETSGETIEVISECEQTSFVDHKPVVTPSVIQLYRSHRKSSLESTYMQHGSDHALYDELEEPKVTEEEDSQHSDVQVDMMQVADASTSQNCPGATSKQVIEEQMRHCLSECIGCAIQEHDSDDDEFQDCRPPSDCVEQHDQETQVVSCLKRKHLQDKSDGPEYKDQETNVVSCIKKKNVSSDTDPPEGRCRCSRLKAVEAELARYKALAACAFQQMCLVRQTLQENNITLVEINIVQITELLNSSKCIINLEGCLLQDCGYDPYVLLNEQYQLIEVFHNAIVNASDTPYASATTLNVTCSKSVQISTSMVRSDANKKLTSQLEFYKNKCVTLDQANLERDNLLETVSGLEANLKMYDGMKYEFATDPAVVAMLDANDVVREIRALKARAELSEHLERELAFERCTVGTLKESLSNLSAQRFAEFETMRYKAREADILKLELDRLRIQFTDVQKLKADNVNLQNKCAELRRAHKKRPSTTTTGIEKYLQFSKEQAAEIDELKKEKQALLCTVVIKECEIVEQEDQIERLVMHVDRLTTTNEEQQVKSQLIVAQLRTDLNSKDNYIAKLDGNLEWVEEKLKQSITTISKDSNQWQNKLTQLEKTCIHYKAKNDAMQDTISSLRNQLEKEEELNRTYSQELKKKNQLLEEIHSGTGDNEIAQKIKSVNKMECILKKSHNAVRKVVEQLAKQYRCDMPELQAILPELVVTDA